MSQGSGTERNNSGGCGLKCFRPGNTSMRRFFQVCKRTSSSPPFLRSRLNSNFQPNKSASIRYTNQYLDIAGSPARSPLNSISARNKCLNCSVSILSPQKDVLSRISFSPLISSRRLLSSSTNHEKIGDKDNSQLLHDRFAREELVLEKDEKWVESDVQVTPFF